MHAKLEETMARGRVADDGRTVRLGPDGMEIVLFASSSYLGLDRDPRVAASAVAEIERSFSASRCFTSPLHREAEDALQRMFRRPVVLAGSTTLAHEAALPLLFADDDVVLYDRQVHPNVQTALISLGARGPRRDMVAHNDLDALETSIKAAVARGARRVWYCADGIYGMFGDRLPVEGLADLMDHYPALHAYLDDAHGMSWCGSHGAGSLIDENLPQDRTVIATSLSKGFGCAGGVLVVPDALTKERLENLGPPLFSSELPPPVLSAIVASANIHLSDELLPMQRELQSKIAFTRRLLLQNRTLGMRLAVREDDPTPVHYIVLGGADEAIAATRSLLAKGFLVHPVAFPAVPVRAGGIRFTLTRAHTHDDIRGLLAAIDNVILEERGASRPLCRYAVASV